MIISNIGKGRKCLCALFSYLPYHLLSIVRFIVLTCICFFLEGISESEIQINGIHFKCNGLEIFIENII